MLLQLYREKMIDEQVYILKSTSVKKESRESTKNPKFNQLMHGLGLDTPVLFAWKFQCSGSLDAWKIHILLAARAARAIWKFSITEHLRSLHKPRDEFWSSNGIFIFMITDKQFVY